MERFHGVDRHKAYSTISVLNREGVDVEFYPSVKDLKGYLQRLGPEDTVVLESSTGSFWWADQIESRGAQCFVLNPHRFRIIKDSWNKTDARGSRNMAKALWVFMVTGEFGLPTVYKPSCAVRELRRLFTYYDLITRQIRMLKNRIQALLVENEVELKEGEKNKLLSPLHRRDSIRNEKSSLSPDMAVRIARATMNNFNGIPYLRRSDLIGKAPEAFNEVWYDTISFLMPVFESIIAGAEWIPEGP